MTHAYGKNARTALCGAIDVLCSAYKARRDLQEVHRGDRRSAEGVNMSEFQVIVIKVGPVQKHPNADTLSMTEVWGYPVIFRTGDFQPGDKAVYVPVDSVVPAGDPRWDFLGEHRRIRAKGLRGIFSMGLLTPADPSWKVGDIVADEMKITKYEPPVKGRAGEPGRHGADFIIGDRGSAPAFTFSEYDLEAVRRHPGVLVDGERVVITEKIHGCNARFTFQRGRLFVGSHRVWKRPVIKPGLLRRLLGWVTRRPAKVIVPDDIWNATAAQYKLEGKLRAHPGLTVYGEVYGDVQDLRYGLGPDELRLAVFDLRHEDGSWASVRFMRQFCAELDLPIAPILYEGPWSRDLLALAEGKTTLPGDHVREGIVIRTVPERRDNCGRVVLKHVGEGYHLRKEAPAQVAAAA